MFGIRPFCQDKVSKNSGGRFHRRGPKSTLNIHAPNSARNCTSAPGAGLAHTVYGTAIGVRPNASPREAGFKTGIRACAGTRRESREHTRMALNGDLPIAVQLIDVRTDLGHRLARQLGLHFQVAQDTAFRRTRDPADRREPVRCPAAGETVKRVGQVEAGLPSFSEGPHSGARRPRALSILQIAP